MDSRTTELQYSPTSTIFDELSLVSPTFASSEFASGTESSLPIIKTIGPEHELVYRHWPPNHKSTQTIKELAESVSHVIKNAGTVDLCLISPLMVEDPTGEVQQWPWPHPTVPVLVIQYQGNLKPEILHRLKTPISIKIHLHSTKLELLTGGYNIGSSGTLGLEDMVGNPISLEKYPGQSSATIGGIVSTSPDGDDLNAQTYMLTAGHMVSSHYNNVPDIDDNREKHLVVAPPSHFLRDAIESIKAKRHVVQANLTRRQEAGIFEPNMSVQREQRLEEYHKLEQDLEQQLRADRVVGHVAYVEFGLLADNRVQFPTSESAPTPLTTSAAATIMTTPNLPTSQSLPVTLPSQHSYTPDIYTMIDHLNEDQNEIRRRFGHVPVRVTVEIDPDVYLNGIVDIAAVKTVRPLDTVRQRYCSRWKNIALGMLVAVESWAQNGNGIVNGLQSIAIWSRKHLRSLPKGFLIPPGDSAYFITHEFVVLSTTASPTFSKPGCSGGLVYGESNGQREPVGLVSNVFSSTSERNLLTVVVPLARVLPRMEKKLGQKLYFVM